MILVDTNVLIDASRADPAARQWLVSNLVGGLAISTITELEFLVGCVNGNELMKVQRALKGYVVVPLSPEISAKAVGLVRTYNLSHGLATADALIAATALVADLPLATKNRKDFRFIAGLTFVEYP